MKKRPFIRQRYFAVLGLSLILSGCASWPSRWGARPCCIEQKLVVRREPIWWHLFDMTVLDPLEQPFRIVRPLRKLFGIPARSANLKSGRIDDSTFFTNRDIESQTAEALRWAGAAPDDLPAAPFTVTKAKTEGKTAGFFVTDSRGRRYLFKLDPVDAPELLSGAEVVTSKLLYAIGYHVPVYEVAFVSPEELRVSPQATEKKGKRSVAFTQAHLDELVAGRIQNSRLRVSASKLINGEVLGPAKMKTFRDCTEMRALKLAYAWVNNIDSKDHNSLLVWEGGKTVGYLFDFGTSLGADAGLGGPKSACAGWVYEIDLKESLLELATLGLHQSSCDSAAVPLNQRVGLFSGRVDPSRWKPYVPNRPFKEMNDEDARWMAARLGKLTRAQIEAAVSAGQYSRAGDAAYLTDMLELRRRAIVEYYLKDDEEGK